MSLLAIAFPSLSSKRNGLTLFWCGPLEIETAEKDAATTAKAVDEKVLQYERMISEMRNALDRSKQAHDQRSSELHQQLKLLSQDNEVLQAEISELNWEMSRLAEAKTEAERIQSELERGAMAEGLTADAAIATPDRRVKELVARVESQKLKLEGQREDSQRLQNALTEMQRSQQARRSWLSLALLFGLLAICLVAVLGEGGGRYLEVVIGPEAAQQVQASLKEGRRQLCEMAGSNRSKPRDGS